MPEIIVYPKNNLKKYKQIVKKIAKIKPRIIKQWINDDPNLIYDDYDSIGFYDKDDLYILRKDKNIVKIKNALLMEFR